jgi:hypothetical protein
MFSNLVLNNQPQFKMETLTLNQTHEPVVASLQEILSEDPAMAAALTASLNIAVAQAKASLNSDLYHAINDEFNGNGWPTTIPAYLDYLDMYTNLQGKKVVKGQEFGKFRFGGSDIIMLFQKPPTEIYMYKYDPGHTPIHFQYGQASVLYNK